MNVSLAKESRRSPLWKYGVEHRVYDIACAAMESRPDYPEFERLWAALDERFKIMKYEYDPEEDDSPMYQMDLSELADEADIDDETALSHLRTMLGAGLILAVVCYQEFNSVSVLVSPHMVAS